MVIRLSGVASVCIRAGLARMFDWPYDGASVVGVSVGAVVGVLVGTVGPGGVFRAAKKRHNEGGFFSINNTSFYCNADIFVVGI